MPDRGIWTLRCQSCEKDFTLEVRPGELVLDFAKSYICPHCHKTPDDISKVKPAGAWHRVIDFHAKAR